MSFESNYSDEVAASIEQLGAQLARLKAEERLARQIERPANIGVLADALRRDMARLGCATLEEYIEARMGIAEVSLRPALPPISGPFIAILL